MRLAVIILAFWYLNASEAKDCIEWLEAFDLKVCYGQKANYDRDVYTNTAKGTIEDVAAKLKISYKRNLRHNMAIGMQSTWGVELQDLVHAHSVSLIQITDFMNETTFDFEGKLVSEATGLDIDFNVFRDQNAGVHSANVTIHSKNVEIAELHGIQVYENDLFERRVKKESVYNISNAALQNVNLSDFMNTAQQRYEMPSVKGFGGIRFSSPVYSQNFNVTLFEDYSSLVMQEGSSTVFPMFDFSGTQIAKNDPNGPWVLSIMKSAFQTLVHKQTLGRVNPRVSTSKFFRKNGQVVTVTTNMSSSLKKLTVEMPTEAWSTTWALETYENMTFRISGYENDHFINQNWKDGEVLFEMLIGPGTNFTNSFGQEKPLPRIQIPNLNQERVMHLLAGGVSHMKEYLGLDGNPERSLPQLLCSIFRCEEDAGIEINQHFINMMTHWFNTKRRQLEKLKGELIPEDITDFELPPKVWEMVPGLRH